MIELDSPAAPAYLAAKLGLRPEELKLTPLGGGVSNHVLLAEGPGVRLVAKQALGRLRVADEWLCERERVHRECAALRACAGLLAPGAVPAVILEDRENFLFAMQAAPPGARTWKEHLLEGACDERLAAGAGELLGALIAGSRPEHAAAFGALDTFEALRLDPYYRTTASRHPRLRGAFERLIAECTARRVALVHGDYSPKNLLVDGGRLVVIDWEVIHWGDPAFDAAFLTNHLALKAHHRPAAAGGYRRLVEAFWGALQARLPDGREWLEPAALRHLGCLLLARVDGKSPVEYLRGESEREAVRRAAFRLIEHPPATVSELLETHFP